MEIVLYLEPAVKDYMGRGLVHSAINYSKRGICVCSILHFAVKKLRCKNINDKRDLQTPYTYSQEPVLV